MSSRYHSPFPPYEIIKAVPKKDGKGYKEPNINDAKELSLMIGTTSTLDVAKDGLVDWQLGQAIFHCAVLPYAGRFDGTNEKGHPDHMINQADFDEYQKEIFGRMKDVLETFSDDGSDVDRELKNYFDGKPFLLPEKVLPCVEVMQTRMKELGVVKIVSGIRMASRTLWVTGEPDIYGFNADGKLVWCSDLKRKNKGTFDRCKSEKGLDENHKLQLGHYLVMLEEYHDALDPKLDIIMSCRDDERAKIVSIADTDQWKQAAIHHNKSWFLRKGWEPQKNFDEGKARANLADIIEHNKWMVNQ